MVEALEALVQGGEIFTGDPGYNLGLPDSECLPIWVRDFPADDEGDEVNDEEVRRAEESFSSALERHEQARLHYVRLTTEFAQDVGEVEAFMNGLYDLGVARAAVDATRLRLKLMGCEDQALTIQAEHRRRHPLSPEITERINDLGTLEETESDAVEAEVRFQEADRTSHTFSEYFAYGRGGPGICSSR